MSIAAKIFDRRTPKRTKTESLAQPMAENMATISGIKVFALVPWGEKLQISRANRNLQAQLAAMPLANTASAGLVSAQSKIEWRIYG
jgi:hypothetical protein